MNESTASEPTISKKVLTTAQEQAVTLTHKVLSDFGAGKVKSLADIEDKYGIPCGNFPREVKEQPFPFPSSLLFQKYLVEYITNTRQRLIAQQHLQTSGATKKLRLKLADEKDCESFVNNPKLKLYREQQPVYEAIIDAQFLSSTPYRGVLQNGGTGSGKTILAAKIIDRIIAENWHKPAGLPIDLPFPIVWFTVKNAVEQTRRALEKAGLGAYLDKTIYVYPYSYLTAQGNGVLLDITQEEDLTQMSSDGSPVYYTKYTWRASALSAYYIFDECHSLAKPTSGRTKAIRALFEMAANYPLINCRFLWMSATAVERINDIEMFVCSSDIDYNGQRITFANFRQSFAMQMALDGRPDLPNVAATARLFKAIGHRVFEIPYFPWPFKAINACRFYRFKTDAHRQQYLNATDEYLERVEKMGRNAPNERALKYIFLLQLRKKVEPIRAEQIADDMHRDFQQGKTPVMGTAFTGSIIRAVFHLCDKYGYTRDDFSIIWGGRANIKPEKLLTTEDLLNIVAEAAQSEDGMSREMKKLIDLNLAWQEDRLLFQDESSAAQDERYQRLIDLKLIGLQNPARRQIEIDNLMSGRSKFGFFTGQSGGTGLSLEHHTISIKGPRVLYATPIYSGKEFIQIFGRCPRRNSISDTYQYVCLMDNTVESEHVAPILDRKLQCIQEVGSRKLDLAEILMNLSADQLKAKILNNDKKIRSIEEAAAQAHEDERTQLHTTEVGEDDEEDDDK